MNINRIDIFLQPSGLYKVFKYQEGWEGVLGHCVPVEVKEYDATQLQTIILPWLNTNHWIVRSWPTGYRAFKDRLRPIRSRAQIIHKRSQLIAHPDPRLDGKACTIDLAFDL